MSSFVSNYEERYYEVHPRNLPWAMSQLGGMPGYTVQGYAPAQNGMCIIVVQVPAGAAQQDWREAPPRRHRHVDWFRISRGLLLALIAVALAYIAYSIFMGGALDMPAQGVTVPTAPPVEMPWDAAGRQVGEAVDGAVRVLVALLTLIVIGAGAWLVLKARGVWKAVRK